MLDPQGNSNSNSLLIVIHAFERCIGQEHLRELQKIIDDSRKNLLAKVGETGKEEEDLSEFDDLWW